MIKAIVITLVTLTLAVGAIMLSASGEGIVILEGYEHGVALCKETNAAMVHSGDAHMWADGVAMYTINEGHLNDPQVKELVKLAQVECAKLTK